MQSLKLVSHYHLCKANVAAVQSYRKKGLWILQARRNAHSAAVQKYDRPAIYQTAHFLACTNPRAELK